MLLLSEEIQFGGTVSILFVATLLLYKGTEMMRFVLVCLPNSDPRLTARHGAGHMPMRIVMSQTLDLPEEANLWDVSDASTLVVTQRGARRSFQKFLASKGIEVVEFDILNPRDVMEYFHDRGYLSVLWECGGKLAASAISDGVIHKVSHFLSFNFSLLLPQFLLFW